MIAFLSLLLHVVVSPFRTKARLEAEIILLRHQLNVLRRRVPSNPKLAVADRLVFVWLYRLFPAVLNAVTIVQPETVIRWHRTGYRTRKQRDWRMPLYTSAEQKGRMEFKRVRGIQAMPRSSVEGLQSRLSTKPR
jgi:hypothetical protein